MIRTSKHAVALLGMSLLGLAACTGNGAATTTHSAQEASVTATDTPLTELPHGSRWQLVSSQREALDLPEASRVTLQIDADRLSGDSSCNQYSAAYTLQDGRIGVQPVIATKRGCMEPLGSIERAWFEALRSLQWISRDGDTLRLHLAAGDTLQFVPAPLATE